ncbi:MAG: peptidoglycan/xylan/chitin deacetylase (PgdA/CDA1 family) [Candidatus Paceibacteria bacterium]
MRDAAQQQGGKVNRLMLYLLCLVGNLLFVSSLWPERALEGSLGVLLLAFGLALWGCLSLRSGIWCRAKWRGPADRPQVALTYDDGPDPVATPLLLDLLQERGVSATFFCVGDKVRAHPQVMRRMRDEGHSLGNHSNRHSNWTNFYGTGRMQAEIGAAQEAFEDVLGLRPEFYRPPIGLANHALGVVTASLGMTIVGWQVRGFDLPGSDPSKVARRVLKGLRPGGVVLLHDGNRDPQAVLEATALVLDGLETRQLQPVTLKTLFSL